MNGIPTAATPSATPIPQVSINTSPAPGKQGPRGLSPRSNSSVVNTGALDNPQVGLDAKATPPNSAGMLPQRSALPPPQVPQKSEVKMGSQQAHPTVQEMIKAAMAGAVGRQDISREAARQAENLGEKTASRVVVTDSDEKVASYDAVMKLADAVEFIVDEFSKEAQPGEGPGALKVMESPGGASLPDKKGQSHHAVPMSTPLQNSGGHSPTNQMQNDYARAPGAGAGTQGNAMKGASKTAAAIRQAVTKLAAEDKALEKKEGEGLDEAKAGVEKAERAHEEEKKASPSLAARIREAAQQVKEAEDAINPAHISAGATVPPDTRESGQSGGSSPHGASMVSSNESVTNLTRREAKAEAKADMKAYVTEPALSASTDSVLQAAFSHTGEAGAKVASAVPGAIKTAAAKALLSSIAAQAQAQKA